MNDSSTKISVFSLKGTRSDVLEKLLILGLGQEMNNECLDYLVKLESKETIKGY